MPTIERIKSSLNKAGIVIDTAEPLFITPELQDCFLYSGKQRPEMYLSSAVRNGISSFHNFCSQSELNNGLKKLQEDIDQVIYTELLRISRVKKVTTYLYHPMRADNCLRLEAHLRLVATEA